MKMNDLLGVRMVYLSESVSDDIRAMPRTGLWEFETRGARTSVREEG